MRATPTWARWGGSARGGVGSGGGYGEVPGAPPPQPCRAVRAPEIVEALRVGIEKAPQVDVGTVIAVPILQLLEVPVLGERGHGGSGEPHGAGRTHARARAEQGKEKARQRAGDPGAERAAGFMAQAPGPAPPGHASRAPAPPRPARPRPCPPRPLRDLAGGGCRSGDLCWPFAGSPGWLLRGSDLEGRGGVSPCLAGFLPFRSCIQFNSKKKKRKQKQNTNS